MVQKSAEEKVRARARKAFEEGKDFKARGDANRTIVEEVRKQIQKETAKGKKSIQSAASAGTARVKRAADAGTKLVEDAVKEGEKRLKRTARECDRQLKRLRASPGAEEALPTAEQEGGGQHAPPVEPQPAGTTPGHTADLPTASQQASPPDPVSGAPSDASPGQSEAPADDTGVAPTAEASGSSAAHDAEEEAEEEAEEPEEEAEESEDEDGEMDDEEPDEEERARAEEQKREQALREQARKEEQKEQQARRAAERLAVLENLPAPMDEMPPWFIQNVQRYYGFDRQFCKALHDKTQEALQAVENQLAPGRAACRECRKWWNGSCEQHVARLDTALKARINAELRTEYEGEAAKAAFRYKEDDEKRARAERQAWDDKQAAARSKAAAREDALREARLQLTPGCKACADCTEADFALGGICSRHEVELEALATRLAAGAAPMPAQARACIVEVPHAARV